MKFIAFVNKQAEFFLCCFCKSLLQKSLLSYTRLSLSSIARNDVSEVCDRRSWRVLDMERARQAGSYIARYVVCGILMRQLTHSVCRLLSLLSDIF